MKPTEAKLFFEIFKKSDVFFEVRILNTNQGVLSGYFNDEEKFLRAINQYDGKYNIFFTMNPISQDVAARSVNRFTKYAKNTTTDKEIECRKWILVDLDPIRPAGVSSTDKELKFAESLSEKVETFLSEQGFPKPIKCMSGNGFHLLIPADMSNTSESTIIVKKFLASLDKMFSDTQVKIDCSTYNAARICKTYGTIACKGDSTKQRPHRRSYIISVPDTMEPVSIDLLKKVISEYGVSEQRQEKALGKLKPSKKVERYSKKVVNVKEFCQNHGIEISHEKNLDNDGICYVLSTCPWNPEHKDKSGYIIEFPNGKIIAGCHHDSCNAETWQTLLAKYTDTTEFSSVSKNDEDGKMSRVEILLNDIQEAGHTLYHDSSENAYVSVPLKNGCKEYMKLRDRRYSQILRQLFFTNYSKSLSRDNIQQALDTLEASAIFDGEEIEPALRCKFKEDKIYYHMADEGNTVLCISAKDGITVLKESPIPFIKTQSMLPQVMPEDIEVNEGEKKTSFRKISKKYWRFKTEDDLLLHNVVLLTRFISDIPAPAVYYIGDRGSAKTTSMRMDKLFVDSSAVDVKALPSSIMDTVTALSGEYMVGFDNIDGKISHELSNLWCVCCSTGYYSKRKLFSDNDSVDIKLNVRLSFSGITTITDRADFIDRCICLSCERIVPTERRTVEEILNEFKEDLPYLLYKGFRILSKAMEVHRTLVFEELPRMADFATWGYAIAEVMKYGGERFLKAYQQNQRNLLEVMVEEDSLLTVLISFVEQRKHFVGSMSELYASLLKEAQAMEVNTVNGWCRNLNSLSRKLFQSQSVLGQFDIHLQRGKSNGKRYIEIWKGEERYE